MRHFERALSLPRRFRPNGDVRVGTNVEKDERRRREVQNILVAVKDDDS